MSKIPPQQLQHETPSKSPPARTAGRELHIPVLLQSVVEHLAPRPGESYLDLTAGYGGHARAIVEKTKAAEKAVLVDRDTQALAHLTDLSDQGAELVHDNYAHFAEEAVGEGKQFDMILVDLGVSSPQLDRADRGFSLKRNGPLDMRMDQAGQTKTASEIVNSLSQSELASIIELYGEEPRGRARTIARAIIQSRPLKTTQELATVVLKTHRGAYQKTHPATRTFQALRIYLNDELGQLERLLVAIPKLLTPGGRVAFISFHSLEDRLVKRFFVEQANAGFEAELDLLTKKAIRGENDDASNPRSRSARLRVAVKK